MDRGPDQNVQVIRTDDDHALIRDVLQSESWDERLRIARERREKILSEKCAVDGAAAGAAVSDMSRHVAAHLTLGRQHQGPAITPTTQSGPSGGRIGDGPYWASQGHAPVPVPLQTPTKSAVATTRQDTITGRSTSWLLLASGLLSGVVVGVALAAAALFAISGQPEMAREGLGDLTSAMGPASAIVGGETTTADDASVTADDTRPQVLTEMTTLGDARSFTADLPPSVVPAAPAAFARHAWLPQIAPPGAEVAWARPSGGPAPDVLSSITDMPAPDAGSGDEDQLPTPLHHLSLNDRMRSLAALQASTDPTSDADSIPALPSQPLAEPARVRLTLPEGLPADTVAKVVASIRQQGASLSGTVRSRFAATSNHVRFFHTEDAAAAQRLAASIGGTARDFSEFVPAPPAGTIEVWLTDKG